MTDTTHRTTYRSDYTPPDYTVDTVDLRFELGEETTRVISRLVMKENYDPAAGRRPLVLDGHRFVLQEIALDGRQLTPQQYSVDAERLTIPVVPSAFTLEVTTELRPQDNTALEGLYRSGGMFCTQCEAQGFRSITYYPDRPDVLAVYTTTIVATRENFPVLLSNGNFVAEGSLAGGLHFATWNDPFKKPSYLFALVAGNLACLEDHYTTSSGRDVKLQIYVHERNRHKCGYALRALQKAMRWDEENFGREYDLDIYMIVAVDDFNMGAMENKGLNIFNSRYVLASSETATDDDFQAIEEVIGHEYFHNWTGNRITCRDWFQLSLKEGLTIFRDQEFAADMQSRGVKRIEDVRYLRTIQFGEDAGPMAHPVRPDSYIEINNFYTATVYNKGAELVRMLRTLLGTERFRRGMDLYFARHDGCAVTVDDFVEAMEEAGGIDLGQFRLWYSQAGTPQVDIGCRFDGDSLAIAVRQSCPPTPGQPEKEPLHIPLVMGLLGRDGSELDVTLAGEKAAGPKTRVLEVRQPEETFFFTGLASEPVAALFRGFSAPVRVNFPYSHDELVLLMSRETDPFCRWEAGQTLATQVMLALVKDWQGGLKLSLDEAFVAAFRSTLVNKGDDRGFIAEALALPSEAYLGDLMAVADPDALFAVRQFVRCTLAEELRGEFLAVRAASRAHAGAYLVDDGRAGERRLGNLCLNYLMTLEDPTFIALCLEQLREADNMTDQIGALVPLASCECPERLMALAEFYERWRDDRQVVDKWFSVQATSSLPGTLATVTELTRHPAFELTNPNRFRALVGAFSQGNQVRFHQAGGGGYRFLADQLLSLIPLNPQVAARLLTPLTRWQRFDPVRQDMMKEELERIREVPRLPRDLYEVVEKCLA